MAQNQALYSDKNVGWTTVQVHSQEFHTEMEQGCWPGYYWRESGNTGVFIMNDVTHDSVSAG